MTTIKDMTTRELIKALDTGRGHSDYWDADTDDTNVRVGSRFVTGGVEEIVWATKSDIRTELNTREHIPSKSEATVIRRLKAKTGQTEEWLRAHPKYGQTIAGADHPRRIVSGEEYAYYVKAYGKQFASKSFIIKHT